jgi:ectoine hydroxylase-related dioxygenase (phytanoyl-CoA dioxygenase family)
VHPGETPQAWHYDDAYVRVPRPHPMVAVSANWASDGFTESNGATEVIPGSHLWGADETAAPDDPRAVKILMHPRRLLDPDYAKRRRPVKLDPKLTGA